MLGRLSSKSQGDVILSNAKIHAEAGRSSPGLSRSQLVSPRYSSQSASRSRTWPRHDWSIRLA